MAMSSVHKRFYKYLQRLPGFRRDDKYMAENEFRATDVFTHRYRDPEVLKSELLKLGFEENQIRIHATNGRGLEVQLPRRLSDEEKKKVDDAFKKAHDDKEAED